MSAPTTHGAWSERAIGSGAQRARSPDLECASDTRCLGCRAGLGSSVATRGWPVGRTRPMPLPERYGRGAEPGGSSTPHGKAPKMASGASGSGGFSIDTPHHAPLLDPETIVLPSAPVAKRLVQDNSCLTSAPRSGIERRYCSQSPGWPRDVVRTRRPVVEPVLLLAVEDPSIALAVTLRLPVARTSPGREDDVQPSPVARSRRLNSSRCSRQAVAARWTCRTSHGSTRLVSSIVSVAPYAPSSMMIPELFR